MSPASPFSVSVFYFPIWGRVQNEILHRYCCQILLRISLNAHSKESPGKLGMSKIDWDTWTRKLLPYADDVYLLGDDIMTSYCEGDEVAAGWRNWIMRSFRTCR
jgi:hypothetical protein